MLTELITNGWALTGKLSLLFSYTYCFVLDIYQKIICGRKQMVHGEQQYTNWQWCSSCCWLVLMGSLTGLRNYFPTPLHHLHPPALLEASWIYAVADPFCPYMCVPWQKWRFMRQDCCFFFLAVLFLTLCLPLPQLSALRWQNKNPRWSSTVRAHPPQGSTWCWCWDAFLFTTSAQRGHLSYCSLSVSMNQSVNSDTLSPHIIMINFQKLQCVKFIDR